MGRIKRFINKYPPGTLVLILFFVTSLFIICYAFWDLDSLKSILREDGVVENLQAILYLFGACIWGFAFVIASRNSIKKDKRRRLFYILFMGFFIFLFLEEISYGQRLFGITTPNTLKELNLQDETNIHNIGTENTKLWIHILHAFLYALLGIIIPILNLGSKRIGSFFKRINFPIVHADLIVCFGISLNFYYEPGFHWSIPLRTLCLLVPFIIIISGKFQWLLNQFKYPLFQMTLLAIIGFLLIALNLNSDTNQYIRNFIAWETRELFMALSLFFFSLFEAHGAWRKKHNGLDSQIK
jgi:hypothetical protein